MASQDVLRKGWIVGNVITILAIVGLLVFGAYAVTASMDSAAYSWAEGQKAQAYATVAVAQIESDTQIRLQELQMLDSAYTRAMLAAFFWPIMALAGLTLAAVVWVQVWLASRRPYYPQRYPQQLPGASWRAGFLSVSKEPAPRAREDYNDFEWDTPKMEYYEVR